jgi:hypothetical protein
VRNTGIDGCIALDLRVCRHYRTQTNYQTKRQEQFAYHVESISSVGANSLKLTVRHAPDGVGFANCFTT